jgi:hypothetical protein
MQLLRLNLTTQYNCTPWAVKGAAEDACCSVSFCALTSASSCLNSSRAGCLSAGVGCPPRVMTAFFASRLAMTLAWIAARLTK